MGIRPQGVKRSLCFGTSATGSARGYLLSCLLIFDLYLWPSRGSPEGLLGPVNRVDTTPKANSNEEVKMIFLQSLSIKAESVGAFIAHKINNGQVLTHGERTYLCKWRKREQFSLN